MGCSIKANPPPQHTSHCKREQKEAKDRKVKLSLPHFESFPLQLYIHSLHLQNRGESNSQPANTYSTDPTAPACITYSQPPPSSGSAADAGLSPTIFSYSCGPTQTTHIYLATATNAPASASSHTPIAISHLPIYAYVGIGIGGILVLSLIWSLWRKCTRQSNHPIPAGQTNHPIPTGQTNYPILYRCRACGSTDLLYRTVQPGNRNGNAGRPYCVCVRPNCDNVRNSNAEHHDRGWVSWCDDKGVEPGNPLCICGRNARQDRAGERSIYHGRRFWTCSTGYCPYFRWID